ncbi:MAG: hypothetical protein IKU70_10680, partial [Clostridia bacterium]|nr:hypothetical protein [Clostridia bacterium]
SEADDMCISFGSLAQQGFPYTVCRPASRHTVHSSAEKIAEGELFRRPEGRLEQRRPSFMEISES